MVFIVDITIYGHMTIGDMTRRQYEVASYDTATVSYYMVISIYGNIYCHIANTIGHTDRGA